MFLRYWFSRWRFATMLNLKKKQNFIWGSLVDWDTSPCQLLSKFVHHMNMAAVCRLDLFGAYLYHPRRVYIWGLYYFLQNFVMINTLLLIIWTFRYLTHLAGKRLFTPTNWGLGAIWPTKWAAISTAACDWKSQRTEPKKAHPCVSSRHLSHQTWKSGTCRWVA